MPRPRFDATARPDGADPWDGILPRLRSAGLRWTPQRRTIVEVLRRETGHISATDLIAHCRDLDPATTPSTVYRTLQVLEGFGLLSHAHTPSGREEYHVLPGRVHGHVFCSDCGATRELPRATEDAVVTALAGELGFAVDLSHVTIAGRCADCRATRAGSGG